MKRTEIQFVKQRRSAGVKARLHHNQLQTDRAQILHQLPHFHK